MKPHTRKDLGTTRVPSMEETIYRVVGNPPTRLTGTYASTRPVSYALEEPLPMNDVVIDNIKSGGETHMCSRGGEAKGGSFELSFSSHIALRCL